MQSLGLSNTQTGIIENIFISKISNLTIRGSEFAFRNYSISDEEQNELCGSILQNGLFVPIIVRYTTQDRYEVISGNRRLNAVTKLGFRKILCHIIDADDKEAFEIALIENLQFKKINPMDEAIAFKKYVQEFGWGGITDLAKRIFKSVSYVDRRIQLVDLPDNLKKDVIDGKLKPSIANELLTVKDGNTKSSLTELIRNRSHSLREFRRIVKEKRPRSTTEEELEAFNFQDITTTAVVEEPKIIDLDQTVKRSFDQAIMSFRFSLDKLSSIIENNEDNWILNETFMQHKRVLHDQISILYKEKKKMTSG